MEVIFKGVGAGKTTEAMKLAAAYGGNVLFLSTEMNDFAMTKMFMNVIDSEEFNDGEFTFASVTSDEHALEIIDAMEEELLVVGEQIDLVVLDVNFGVSHTQWFDLATNLENIGFAVVVTQQLARAKANGTGKTQVVKA
ncbi:MAG: hypothetical protein ACRC9Y_20005 [Aeromonas veronii]